MSRQIDSELQAEMVERYNNGEFAGSIGKSMGFHTTTVKRILNRHGITLRKMTGENHNMWKGGRVRVGCYIGIWCPQHHRANKQGYVLEHILVLENKLNIKITKKDVVHHINGDKHDNNPDNLHICTPSQHESAHRSYEKLLKHFLNENTIVFRNGEYQLEMQ
jgi:hypothetical protein